MIEYKGYIGKVELDDDGGIFHGEVINTRDVITFKGASVAELRRAFRHSVDDYLAFCAERGEEPEKPFSGQFVTRIPPALHRQIHHAANLAGKSLNAWITETLQAAVAGPGPLKLKKTGRRARATARTTRQKSPSRRSAARAGNA